MKRIKPHKGLTPITRRVLDLRIVLSDRDRDLAEFLNDQARANMRTLSAQVIYLMRAQMGQANDSK